MNLDDELDDLSSLDAVFAMPRAYREQKLISVRAFIEQRDAAYEHFLKTNGEAIAQLDGMQLIRWAFRRGRSRLQV